MKQTPFTKSHLALGAKMAEFAGYHMPISYKSINEEHATVRRHAGVFDVSHMGEFLLEGGHALDLVQQVTSNDASKLVAGMVQYSCMVNRQGGIVDDLLVYCLEPGRKYMLVVNAGNIQKDWEWISQHNHGGVRMYNISDETCLLAVQGPNACRLLQPLAGTDIMNLHYYRFVRTDFAGVGDVLISATGYTGAGGVEIYFEDKGDAASRVWDAIAALGIRPVGLGARDTLRLEMGFCLYGSDINDTTSPLEAGLGWITKFSKDFTGRPVLEAQQQTGISRRLMGFELLERGIARHDHLIYDGYNLIGRVTSGTQSPTLGKGIGMGYVDRVAAVIGKAIHIRIRERYVKAKLVKMPFETISTS